MNTLTDKNDGGAAAPPCFVFLQRLSINIS